MHSSRMHTGCSLTVCQSLLLGGMSAPGGVSALGGGGVPALGGGFCSGGVVSQHSLRQTPLPCGQNHRRL